MPRLLVCRECKTIETLPLYDGPKELEAKDPVLDRVVRTHVMLHGDVNNEAAALLTVSEDKCNCPQCKSSGPTMWEAHRDEILGGLQERWTGFHPEFYATRDTFSHDAMRCFNLHRRPKGADCIDYQDDSRRVTPHDWKGRNVYLCDFCPVNSAVEFAKNAKAGLYKGPV